MKLLRHIILLIAPLLIIAFGNRAQASSNLSFQQVQKIQDTAKKDTTKVIKKMTKSDLDDKLEYYAKDSVDVDRKNSIMHLYGKARVIYQGFELDAEYIRFNSKTNIIYARGVTDKKGQYTGRPIFKMGNDGASSADSIYYNTVLKKGDVYEIYKEQDGGVFSGGKIRVQPDNELNVSHTMYSTCNLPQKDAHYGIMITKGIATETQIIVGPSYMTFEGVPLPIAIPFGFFPKPNKKSSGIILPTPGEDATRGFSLTNGGYYFAFNDYVDAKIIGNIFTNGSYDLNLASNYLRRYKYNGNLNLAYSSTRNGLEGTAAYKPAKNFHIGWTHSQNANARPGTTFSASVNAGTSSYFSTTAATGTYDIGQIAQNTMSSSISYGKVFGEGLFNLTAALTHSQETQNKTVSLVLPNVSLNMSTLNPFDSKTRVGDQRWYQKISVGYSLQASNKIDTKENLLFKKDALKRFNNGFMHTIPVSLPFNLFQYLNFNASVNYNERWYMQTIRHRTIRLASSDSIAIDTANGFRRAGDYTMSMGMSTKLYGKKEFKNLGKIKAIRHVMTPTISGSYNPDFSKSSFGYYKEEMYYTNDARPGKSVPITGIPIVESNGVARKYSIFQNSIFGGPSAGQNASIGFSLDNTVELKVASEKDTTGTGERKIPIIQGLSFSTNYNFMAVEKKLSPISFGGRSQITDKLGFNFGGSLSPYSVEERSITTIVGTTEVVTTSYQEVDKYVFSQGKLPRLTSFTFSTDYSLNPDALKSRNKNIDDLNKAAPAARTAEQSEQLAAVSRDPNAFVDFNIPWNISFSYSFNYTNSLGIASTRSISNSLNFNGDFNLTPKWKIQFNSGYDFKAKNLSYTSFAIYRDLHCWDLSASWIPFGAYQSYSIDIKVKASILQDLKLSKRKNYYTKYL